MTTHISHTHTHTQRHTQTYRCDCKRDHFYWNWPKKK